MTNNELRLTFGLPGLNEIIAAAKKHHMAYATMKKKHTQAVVAELIAQGCIPPHPYQAIDIEFIWIETGRARDPDNIRVGAKFVLDAMVHQGIMPDDSMKYVKLLADTFRKGKERGVIARWTGYPAESI